MRDFAELVQIGLQGFRLRIATYQGSVRQHDIKDL